MRGVDVQHLWKLVATMVVSFAMVACGDAADNPDGEPDSGVDAGLSDVGDAGPADAGDVDDAGSTDADPSDAGADTGDSDTGSAPTHRPAVYAAGRTLSPITASVAEHLQDIASAGPGLSDDVFAKIGASNTVNRNHLHCFAGPNVDLDGRDALRPTVDYFLGGDAAGTTPYERESLATTVGWSAYKVLEGDPSPLDQEVAALSPRYGLVHFGTNDIQNRNIHYYAENLMDIADQLIADGIIPVFTSLPPRDDDPDADAWVPRYNAVMRGVAQARQVPFIDLHRELMTLPDHGIGGDGIHLNVYRPSGARGCVFDSAGLHYGHNVRNLLTLQTLDRTKSALDGDAADATAPALSGIGTTSDAFLVQGFPFTDLRDTSTGGQRLYDRYDGCNAAQDESGAEYVYRVELDTRTTLHAFVLDRGEVDIDLHLLDGTASPQGCIDRAHKALTATVDPGVYYFVLDTFVANGDEKAGEYLFVLLDE